VNVTERVNVSGQSFSSVRSLHHPHSMQQVVSAAHEIQWILNENQQKKAIALNLEPRLTKSWKLQWRRLDEEIHVAYVSWLEKEATKPRHSLVEQVDPE